MSEPRSERFASFDGTELAVHRLGGGRPVLLLHGLFSDAQTNWIRFGHAQRLADAGFEGRIELAVDDVHEMRWPDAFADIIISRSTIHHWHDPRKALRDIFRVLKPGGIAMIHDVRRDPAPEAIEEFNRLRAQKQAEEE